MNSDTQHKPDSFTETLPSGTSFDMIFVEGGDFDMGGSHVQALDREKPVHRVRVSSFYMAKFPITQLLWKAVMKGKNPSRFKGDSRPVEQVSWKDAKAFLGELNRLLPQDYRLPTEAEWEFAVRGGKYSEDFLYAGSDKLKEVGWYNENSYGETQVVGQKLPNELGIYDMSGNVFEWCKDRYSSKYYKACGNIGIVEDPQGPKSGADRLIRGGHWGDPAWLCRVSYRRNASPEYRYGLIGFRLVVSSQSGG